MSSFRNHIVRYNEIAEVEKKLNENIRKRRETWAALMNRYAQMEDENLPSVDCRTLTDKTEWETRPRFQKTRNFIQDWVDSSVPNTKNLSLFEEELEDDKCSTKSLEDGVPETPQVIKPIQVPLSKEDRSTASFTRQGKRFNVEGSEENQNIQAIDSARKVKSVKSNVCKKDEKSITCDKTIDVKNGVRYNLRNNVLKECSVILIPHNFESPSKKFIEDSRERSSLTKANTVCDAQSAVPEASVANCVNSPNHVEKANLNGSEDERVEPSDCTSEKSFPLITLQKKDILIPHKFESPSKKFIEDSHEQRSLTKANTVCEAQNAVPESSVANCVNSPNHVEKANLNSSEDERVESSDCTSEKSLPLITLQKKILQSEELQDDASSATKNSEIEQGLGQTRGCDSPVIEFIPLTVQKRDLLNEIQDGLTNSHLVQSDSESNHITEESSSKSVEDGIRETLQVIQPIQVPLSKGGRSTASSSQQGESSKPKSKGKCTRLSPVCATINSSDTGFETSSEHDNLAFTPKKLYAEASFRKARVIGEDETHGYDTATSHTQEERRKCVSKAGSSEDNTSNHADVSKIDSGFTTEPSVIINHESTETGNHIAQLNKKLQNRDSNLSSHELLLEHVQRCGSGRDTKEKEVQKFSCVTHTPKRERKGSPADESRASHKETNYHFNYSTPSKRIKTKNHPPCKQATDISLDVLKVTSLEDVSSSRGKTSHRKSCESNRSKGEKNLDNVFHQFVDETALDKELSNRSGSNVKESLCTNYIETKSYKKKWPLFGPHNVFFEELRLYKRGKIKRDISDNPYFKYLSDTFPEKYMRFHRKSNTSKKHLPSTSQYKKQDPHLNEISGSRSVLKFSPRKNLKNEIQSSHLGPEIRDPNKSVSRSARSVCSMHKSDLNTSNILRVTPLQPSNKDDSKLSYLSEKHI